MARQPPNANHPTVPLPTADSPPPDYCRAISYPPPVYKEFSDRRGECGRRIRRRPWCQCMKISSRLPTHPVRFFRCRCPPCCWGPYPLPAALVTPLLPRISERAPSTHHHLSRNSRNRQSSNINPPKCSPARPDPSTPHFRSFAARRIVRPACRALTLTLVFPGGRTAWSSSVHIGNISVPARFWYDGQYVDKAKEDAAEVALQRLCGGPQQRW